MNWLTFYDEYLIKMTSEQNNPNKLELILYKQFPSSLEFYGIYLVGRHFPSSFTVFCCRSVYVNHISNKMQYNSDSQLPVHRLLMVYKASEKASTKSLQRCPHKSMYMCAYSYNVWAYLHSYIPFWRMHADAAWPSTTEYFLPTAVSICRQAL